MFFSLCLYLFVCLACLQSFFAEEPAFDIESRSSFESLHISRPLLRAITGLRYKEPTPVQRRAIPVLLKGKDICASAVTGSGALTKKTLLSERNERYE